MLVSVLSGVVGFEGACFTCRVALLLARITSISSQLSEGCLKFKGNASIRWHKNPFHGPYFAWVFLKLGIDFLEC